MLNICIINMAEPCITISILNTKCYSFSLIWKRIHIDPFKKEFFTLLRVSFRKLYAFLIPSPIHSIINLVFRPNKIPFHLLFLYLRNNTFNIPLISIIYNTFEVVNTNLSKYQNKSSCCFLSFIIFNPL